MKNDLRNATNTSGLSHHTNNRYSNHDNRNLYNTHNDDQDQDHYNDYGDLVNGSREQERMPFVNMDNTDDNTQ